MKSASLRDDELVRQSTVAGWGSPDGKAMRDPLPTENFHAADVPLNSERPVRVRCVDDAD